MIRVGIGGWTYAPWRGSFFPPGLSKSRELEFASRQVSAIEVNGTFYKTQTPPTFLRWAAETPEDFMFTLKAPGYVVNRRVLAETGEGIARFAASGISELGAKLGPILWQFAPTRQFVEDDIAAFLELLPREVDGLSLRHALEVRHKSFLDPRFVNMARSANAGIIVADAAKYPVLADLTGDFVYARLQRASEEEPAGYPPTELDGWAARARHWETGGEPSDLPRIGAVSSVKTDRPVFLFFINGFKERAPVAATALLARLRAQE